MTDPTTTAHTADRAPGRPPVAPDAPAAFVDRHIGPRAADIDAMLAALGHDSLESLMAAAVPGRVGAEGANPPRNLSGKRTARAGDSEVPAGYDRGGGRSADLSRKEPP